MEQHGVLSLLPPIIAIVLAIWTRQVYLSLIVGIVIGYLVVSNGSLIDTFFSTIEGIVSVFEDLGNTRTIIFCALVGGLLILVKRSGGVEGFLQYIQKRLSNTSSGDGRLKVQLFAYITGLLVFVETSISALTVGTIFRPLFDKFGISRDKLAYLTDSSSAPSSILIPFNAWGAFIMGLLVAEGFSDPFGSMIRSLPFNIYPILTVLIAFIVIIKNWNVGPMKASDLLITQQNAESISVIEQKYNDDDDWMNTPHIKGIVPKARNMLIPLATMIFSMPLILVYTGWENVNPDDPYIAKIFEAMGSGSGSLSVLSAVVLSILVAGILYKMSGVMGIKTWVHWTLKGTTSMVPLAVLMLLAFAIGDVCRNLGTGAYVASVASTWLHPGLLPVIVFICTGFIAFSTGTSWGTFAIMMAIALPISADIGADTYLVIAAVLGGGVFGDHCSPISDTTIISSLASGTEHISHVKTQLPYALIAGFGSIIFYLLMGFLR